MSKKNQVLLLSSSRLLGEIQDQFRATYPFLKLEFFAYPPELENDFPAQMRLDPTSALVDLGYSGPEQVLELNDRITVAWIEMAFDERFGMCARVYRLEGENWVETFSTQGWTLARQNKVGQSKDSMARGSSKIGSYLRTLM